MKRRTLWQIAVAFAAVLLLMILGPSIFNAPPGLGGQAVSSGIGNVSALQRAYDRWATDYARGGGDEALGLSLGYSKGLSTEFTKAHGRARLDLADGSVFVEVSDLPREKAFDVWLVDNRSGPGRSVKPEDGDAMLRLGRLAPEADNASLETRLEGVEAGGFEIDMVVVAEAGHEPGDAGLLFGSPSLFQKLYYNDRRGWYASLGGRKSQPAIADLAFLVPRPAYAAKGASNLHALVRRGENLFFNHTFEGNGRTCGTCHPRENNFTLDPAFIETLPDDDPLFVAEFNPDLAQLENPRLMREFGLILENVDGFEMPTAKFVMRGVPHTLALGTSIENGIPDGTEGLPDDNTGWDSGGAPGGGSLRDFATGAVVQHFTKTLNRIPGQDFRLPNDSELDALEAFQLSLGRQEELDLGSLVLLSDKAASGLQVFLNQGKCNACHLNAGANSLNPISMTIANQNFDTGVENFVHPADSLIPPEPRPRDGGFGRNGALDMGFGNGEFATPPLVEAADSPPFFHNNAVDTIEDAVRFYNSKAFNSSPSTEFLGSIVLSETEVQQVAAFLRVINAVENIGYAITTEQNAMGIRARARARELLRFALHETTDAYDVLLVGSLHPDATSYLGDAMNCLESAIQAKKHTQRAQLIEECIDYQESALAVMVDGSV
ncbi:MAG: hypothetical protein ACE5Q3_09060 [Alphaproteobacteria bacterium]